MIISPTRVELDLEGYKKTSFANAKNELAAKICKKTIVKLRKQGKQKNVILCNPTQSQLTLVFFFVGTLCT